MAKRMSLDFYKTIFYTAVSEKESTVTEEDWDAYTEWDWKRSLYHEVNETKKYPFLICDEIPEGQSISTMDDSLGYVKVALGYLFSEEVDFEETLELLPAVNTEKTVCVVGSFDSTKAAETPLVVQPISFLMKISIGTADFTKSADEYSDDSKLQYAVVGCPGLDEEYGEDWWNSAFDAFVPWLDWLLESGVSTDTTLLELKPLLEENPDYCDSLLVNGVETYLTELGYAIVTLIADDTRSTQCFQLFAYAMAAAPEICYIERIIPTRTDNTDEVWITQSDRVCETPFHDRGLTGKGEIVAVSDTGLDLKSCYFAESSPPDESFFGPQSDISKRKVVQYVPYLFPYQADPDDVSQLDFSLLDVTDDVKGHGTHVAGTIAGSKSTDGINNVEGFANGVARDAKIAFTDIGASGIDGGDVYVPEVAYLLGPGQNAGANIHSASWGSSVKEYGSRDVGMDLYMYNDESFLVIAAAGNSGKKGPQSVASPCKAKNTLCVGATEFDGCSEHTRAEFSSIGPTIDGRIKPDIMAPGVSVLSVGAESDLSCDPDVLPMLGKNRYGLASKSGTSMATPVVSGNAAIIHQYFKEGWYVDGTKNTAKNMTISGTLLKAILINGAQPTKGYGLNEVDSNQGFGILSLTHSVPLSGENDMTAVFSDNQTLTESGEVKEYSLDNICGTGSTYEFSVTLVWADSPGVYRGLQLLMNDLDLTVTQKSVIGTTTVHHPNGRSSKDNVNNVERIRFIADRKDTITYSVKASKLEYNKGKTFSLVAVSRCNDFEPVSQRNAVCYTLYDCDGNGSKSGAYHLCHGWFSSFAFILFSLLIFIH